MATFLPEEGKAFENPSPDTYIATCYKLIELGTHEDNWNGDIAHNFKVDIGWELTDAKMTDGRPFTVNKRYNFKSGEGATLRLDLESWRGKKFTKEEIKQFDISKLLGVPCLVGVSYKEGKSFPLASTIVKLPNGMQAPKLINPIQYFCFEPFDIAMFDALPEKTREFIKESPEFKARMGNYSPPVQQASAASTIYDDGVEIPF